MRMIMATDKQVLRSISRGDREEVVRMGVTTSDIAWVYFYWYEEYVEQLKAQGRRFPGTTKDIAIEAFGREDDRQAIYKNPHIKKIHQKNLTDIGQEARSKKTEITREETTDNRADKLDSTNIGHKGKFDILIKEKAALEKKVQELERSLELERCGRQEEKAAIEHLFETGRRVWL
jgi:hypothetical protein